MHETSTDSCGPRRPRRPLTAAHGLCDNECSRHTPGRPSPQKEMYQEALEDYNAVIRLDKGHVDAHFHRRLAAQARPRDPQPQAARRLIPSPCPSRSEAQFSRNSTIPSRRSGTSRGCWSSTR